MTNAGLFITMTCATAILAYGESRAQEADNSNGSFRGLSEIVVTAQKRIEDPQTVPIGVTALSGDALLDLGVSESELLGLYVPGLEIATSNGESSQLIVFMRGAGLNDFNTNNAGPVGIYADEIYLSSAALTAFQLFDIERVEILKGPQGTLYGRNTTGGAIKFVSNKPTDDFSFQTRASYAEFNTSSLDLAVSGPLSENVSGRIAFSKDDSDGYGTNLVDGSDTNGTDALAYRGFLQADFTENFSLLASVHGASVSSPGASFSPLGLTTDGTTPCAPDMIAAMQCVDLFGYRAPPDPYEGNYNDIREIDLDSSGGFLQLDWQRGNSKLTSITAFDELDRMLPEERDGSPNNLLFVEFGVDSETFSQELRVLRSGDRYQWLLGAYYLNEKIDQNQTVDLLSDLRGIVPSSIAVFLRTLNEQEIDTYAIFGDVEWFLTKNIHLTLGARFTEETREFSARGQTEDEESSGLVPAIVYDEPNLETDSDAVSWRLVIDYSRHTDELLYASISRGFKSGGFNGGFVDPTAAQPQLQPFDPEFVLAYEIGFKSDFLDNRLRLNTAVFFNDFSDLQVFTQINTGETPVLVLDNASDAEALGLELEATAVPIDGLTLGLSASLMDTELTDFVTGTGVDFSGNRIALTPDRSATGLIRYDRKVSTGVLSFQATAGYKSDFFFSTGNNPLLSQDGYTIYNFRIEYENKAGTWGVAAFVNNAGDEAYLQNVNDLSDFGFLQRTFGTPRVSGVELNLNF